ncbi:MAG: hypothetical protein WA056_04840 [Gallionella sp.]
MTSDDSQQVFFSSKRSATSHCYDLAKRSLLAADLEINRVWSGHPAPTDYAEKAQRFQLILIDLHFFFISIRNLYRYLEKIVLDPTYAHLRPELDRLNDKWFRHYSSGREAFEHIDQRLPGEKHENKIVEIEENGARRKIHYGLYLSRGIFAHSDLEWDISLSAFNQLKNEVNIFLQSVVQSSKTTSGTAP